MTITDETKRRVLGGVVGGLLGLILGFALNIDTDRIKPIPEPIRVELSVDPMYIEFIGEAQRSYER